LVSLYKLAFRLFGPSTVEHAVGQVKVEFPLEQRWQNDRFLLLQEPELLKDMMAEVDADDVVYDLGAYVGSQALAAAAATPDGEVVAFEPHPQSYERLKTLVDWSDHDVTTYDVALAAESGTVSMRDASEPRASIYDDEGLEVEAVRGDDLVEKQKLPHPTVLKMDVEGAELEVLRGLEEQLSRPECRLVYCELHPRLAPEGQTVPDDVVALLERLGFDCELTRYGSKDFLKATR
jgi:FkbM family methyltransferase